MTGSFVLANVIIFHVLGMVIINSVACLVRKLLLRCGSEYRNAKYVTIGLSDEAVFLMEIRDLLKEKQ